jgi:hypothetical protein
MGGETSHVAYLFTRVAIAPRGHSRTGRPGPQGPTPEGAPDHRGVAPRRPHGGRGGCGARQRASPPDVSPRRRVGVHLRRPPGRRRAQVLYGQPAAEPPHHRHPPRPVRAAPVAGDLQGGRGHVDLVPGDGRPGAAEDVRVHRRSPDNRVGLQAREAMASRRTASTPRMAAAACGWRATYSSRVGFSPPARQARKPSASSAARSATSRSKSAGASFIPPARTGGRRAGGGGARMFVNRWLPRRHRESAKPGGESPPWLTCPACTSASRSRPSRSGTSG